MVLCIHSKTPDTEKQAFCKDPDSFLTDVDLLIYTPTLTVGVDIQTKVDILVGFFKPHLPLSAIQQLRRVRNVLEGMLVGLAPASSSSGGAEISAETRAELCDPHKIPAWVDRRLSDDGRHNEFPNQNYFYHLWAKTLEDQNRSEVLARFLGCLDFSDHVFLFRTPEEAGLGAMAATLASFGKSSVF